VFGPEASAVSFYDGSAEGESHSEAIRFGGVEGVEESRGSVVLKAWSVVGDGEFDEVVFYRSGGDGDYSVGWCCLE